MEFRKTGVTRESSEKCAASPARLEFCKRNFLRENFNYFLGIHYSMLIDTCSVPSFLIFKVPGYEYCSSRTNFLLEYVILLTLIYKLPSELPNYTDFKKRKRIMKKKSVAVERRINVNESLNYSWLDPMACIAVRRIRSQVE